MVSSGALSFIRNTSGATGTGSNGAADIYFDASGSNSVYTDNGKVYPASIALNFIIKT